MARQHLTDFAFSPLCALLRRELSSIGDATQGCNVCHLGEHGGGSDDDGGGYGGDIGGVGGHEDKDRDEINDYGISDEYVNMRKFYRLTLNKETGLLFNVLIKW